MPADTIPRAGEITRRLAQIVDQLNENQQHLNYLKMLGRGDGIGDGEKPLHQQRIKALEQGY